MFTAYFKTNSSNDICVTQVMLFFTTRIVCNVNVFPRAVAMAAIACVDCLSLSTRVRKKINRCILNIILKPSRNHLRTKISLNLHLKHVNHSLNNGNIAQGPLKRNITAVTHLYNCLFPSVLISPKQQH